MARRIRAREALRLRASGLSQNAIASAVHMSKHSVREVLDAAEASRLTWDDEEGMTDSEVYVRLFPDKAPAGPVYPDPDWDRVHRGLARMGVTLKLPRSEYAEAAVTAGESAMSYDRFCKRYGEFTVRRNVVSRMGHKAGRNMEVDWSGPTIALVDPVTGEVSKDHLFVACLPFNRYSYVEPTLDMKQDTWLRCHAHDFEFLGGSTPVIVPDNLKTGIRSHAREGEVALTPLRGDGRALRRRRHPRARPQAPRQGGG